jgi:anthranilate 1,2-dioxygenase ferredoxin subunit
MSEHWHTLMPEADFPADGKHTARINGWWVLVAKAETGYYAINDRCTHQASQLSGGRIRRGAVMCPLHGARFELASGRCLGGAYKDLRTFPLRLHHGMIEVAVPLHGPTMEDLPVVL